MGHRSAARLAVARVHATTVGAQADAVTRVLPPPPSASPISYSIAMATWPHASPAAGWAKAGFFL